MGSPEERNLRSLLLGSGHVFGHTPVFLCDPAGDLEVLHPGRLYHNGPVAGVCVEEQHWCAVEPALREPEGPDALGGHADSGKAVVRIAASGNLRVDDRACRRQLVSRYVVVGDEDIEPVALGIVDLGDA